MSKKCNHHSFWEIYKLINSNRFLCSEKNRTFKCSSCGKKCVAKLKCSKSIKNNPIRRLIIYLLWLLPAFIIIALVTNSYLDAFVAIFIAIAYHMLVILYIINSNKLKITKK